jgi:YbbR domain-containing protein
VTRLLRVIVHNWPLKLAAIGLATLLYAGLVLSQSTQLFPGVIPVKVVNQPENTFLVTSVDPVTEVRYFSPSGAVPITSTFRATVDITGVEPGSGPVAVPVVVESVDRRITVIGSTPDVVTVQLDDLVTRHNVPVMIDYGTPPEGFEVGDVTVTPPTVSVSGPASVVDQVVGVRGTVQIQPSGISVDQDVLLAPVDNVGDAVSPVNVEPRTARVQIPVFQNRRSRTVPVRPVITGTPAAGYEVASVTVLPATVTVEGSAEQLSELAQADTLPVSVTGASNDIKASVGLALPSGIVPLGDAEVTVTVTLRPVTATRTFETGIELTGTRSDLVYTVPVESVLVVIGGSVAELDRLEGATLVADLDVSALAPGTTAVPVTVDLPVGLTLVSANPPTVQVTVTAAPVPSASPAGIVTPSASPGGG